MLIGWQKISEETFLNYFSRGQREDEQQYRETKGILLGMEWIFVLQRWR
jgi:hypothetical protein